jgi:hypothetical protein
VVVAVLDSDLTLGSAAATGPRPPSTPTVTPRAPYDPNYKPPKIICAKKCFSGRDGGALEEVE